MMDSTKSPHSVRLLLTNKCNLNCSICLRNSSKKSSERELTTEDWLNLFERLRELRVFNISLSGGEVLLRKDLFVLLERLRKNRMHRITLLTNGTLISEKISFKLDRLKIKNLAISLDGMGEVHDKIRGSGSFKETIKGIKNLLSRDIIPTISFTPTRENYKSLEPLVDFLVLLGIKAIQVNTLSPEGRCGGIYKELVLKYPQQVKEILEIIEKKKREYKHVKISCQFGFYYYLPILYRDFQKKPENYEIQHLKKGCGAASTSCTICPNGDMVPCEGFKNFKGGNITEQDFNEIWRESENFKIIRSLAKVSMLHTTYCKDCKYIYLCDAGCRAMAYLAYNDLLAPSILCPFKKGYSLY
jgi:SynChlorMet cassette radical SAM/SPASM protein ScmE